MSSPKNAMEIFQLLDKSNCRECGEKTCLSFAGAVFTGRKKIDGCPKLDPDTIERFSGQNAYQNNGEGNREDVLKKLKNEITGIDLSAAARRTGARFSGDRLTLKILGRDFSVNTAGKIFSDIHINSWVAVPFLNYILYGKGLPVSKKWVSFTAKNERGSKKTPGTNWYSHQSKDIYSGYSRRRATND